MLSHNAEGTEK